MYQSDLKHPDQSLQNKLHRIYALSGGKKIDLSFRPPYLNLLQKLGNPHLRLPPVIHVAGTNGKGSVIAMLRAIYEAAGYNVHTYTSPHLIRFNERIVLAGHEIDDATLEDLIDEVLELNENAELTFFEITTAIAFTAFSRIPADLVLLEVGMGGRLDCTNVIENPALSIITGIALDHTEFLGDTLSKIAAEKAGIIKPHIPCIIGPEMPPDVQKTIEAIAQQNATRVHIAKRDTDQQTALLGPHQKHNLATALTALEMLRETFPVQNAHIQTGLQKAHWPARLQKLDPQNFGLSAIHELFLDGGHNPAAGEALARQAALWAQDNKPLIIIIGMMRGKDVQTFATSLMEYSETIYVVNITNEPNSYTAQDLKQRVPAAKINESYLHALADIEKTHTSPARILICGSLYLAGQVLQATRK